MVDLWFLGQNKWLTPIWQTRSNISQTVNQAMQWLQPKWLQPIAWLNIPTIGSQFSKPVWSEKTIATKETIQTVNIKPQVKTPEITSDQMQNIKVQQEPVDYKNVIGELWATILSNPNANIEETKAKFPEFSSVDTQVFWKLWATKADV